MMMPHTLFSTPLSGSAKVAERRIRNIFQGQRKRPPLPLLILGAIVILLCGSLVSCQTEADNPPQSDPVPDSDAGLSLENLSPAERAQAFLSDADNVYALGGTIELYGETAPVLVPAVDGDESNVIGSDRTYVLDILKAVDLSEYQQTEAPGDSEQLSVTFYAGIGEEKCQITLSADLTASDMTIRFQFDDGAEYAVTGPVAMDLFMAADRAESGLLVQYEADDSIWKTGEDGERQLLTRGNGMILLTIFELTMEHTEPIQDPGDTAFDTLLEVVGGETYRYDSERLRFQKEGSEELYAIQGGDEYASLMRSVLRTSTRSR